MLKVYKCTTECTWNGRYWKEDELTKPLSPDLEPPNYFKLVTDKEELTSVLDQIDEEEDPDTFADFSQQMLDVGKTGTGIGAGDLHFMNYAQLKKKAKGLDIFDESIRTCEGLIEIIEEAEGE